jgi:hypothetical protein
MATLREQLHAVIDSVQLGDVSTPLAAAEAFCEWDDEKQAQFFIEVARIMQTWGYGKHETQGFYIGGHLKTCACSTEEARDFVRSIADRLVAGAY